jgi:mannosyl-oligosaccharide alpha-1,2-mannosidase
MDGSYFPQKVDSMLLFTLLSLFLPSDPDRAAKVRSAFRDAWSGYRRCAFGRDFLRPITCKGATWMNASLTMIDSLDALWILGFRDEFNESVAYLEHNFTFQATGSVFELVIRVIGGLLSAYQLSKRESLLGIAEKFALDMLVAFDTPTKMPMPNVDLANACASTWGWAPRSTFLAHAGSLAPELMTLAMHCKNERIRKASDEIMDFFFTRESFSGLWPLRIDFSTGLFGDNDFSFDAYGDSFYEYLLKLYLMTDKQCVKCGELYKNAMGGLKKYLLRTMGVDTFVGTVKANAPEDHLSYLSFFLPGLIALGSRAFEQESQEYLSLAISLAETAARWHNATRSGLMGDSYDVRNGILELQDPSFKLRPEFIESCFYLWRLTGDEKWRDIGWSIFHSISINCRATHGFGELRNVNFPEMGIADVQDSYLLAETFKYAFLLFSDSELMPLDQYVFTTEGHPLRPFDQEWLAEHYSGKNGYRIKGDRMHAEL